MANRVLTLAEQAEKQKMILAWGKKTKANLALTVTNLGLTDKMKLIKSFSVSLKKRDGDVEAVTFKYIWYGLFSDVGAKNVFGKGITLPALHWKAKAINPRTPELAELLGEYYASVAVKNIEFHKK